MAGKQYEKFASSVFYAFRPDAAIKTFHRFFTEGQAEACTALTSPRGFTGLDIALEDAGQFIGRDSVAGVLDTYENKPGKF